TSDRTKQEVYEWNSTPHTSTVSSSTAVPSTSSTSRKEATAANR
ncbi:hypothetical protein MTO96_044848, partial [Rhipicephalus appendiculatus]